MMAPVSRQIDDELRLVSLLRVPEHVGEHEAAFRVRIDHFDRLARHRRHDISGAHGITRRHVFDAADQADRIDVGLALGERMHQADHGGGATHVALHVFHAGRTLDRDAAGVEDHAFADEAQRLLRLLALRAVPNHDRHARGPRAALPDAQQEPILSLSICLTSKISTSTPSFSSVLVFSASSTGPRILAGSLTRSRARLTPLTTALSGANAAFAIGMSDMDDDLLQAVAAGVVILLGQVLLEAIVT